MSTVLASFSHWTIAYILCCVFDYKMIGIGISTGSYYIIRFLLRTVFARCDKELSKHSVALNDPKSWENLSEMHQYGFSTMTLKVMTWWAFDVFTQLAAFLSVRELAAQSILKNIGLLTFMIPVGLSGATTFIIGQYMGRGQIKIAKRVAGLCYIITMSWAFLSCLILYLCRGQIIKFQTSNEEIQKVLKSAWSILQLFVFFDCMQAVNLGMVAGVGLVK